MDKITVRKLVLFKQKNWQTLIFFQFLEHWTKIENNFWGLANFTTHRIDQGLLRRDQSLTVYWVALFLSLKVSKSQKLFFLKLHCPKMNGILGKILPYEARAEFCLISCSFFGQWSLKKKCFWDLLTFSFGYHLSLDFLWFVPKLEKQFPFKFLCTLCWPLNPFWLKECW